MTTNEQKPKARPYGVRWVEFDPKSGPVPGRRTDRMVKKERFFRTEADLDRFIEKQAEHPRFYAWHAFLG